MNTSLAGVVVLAGGLSTRMGTPKAQLTLPTGETLLDYHIRQAAQLKTRVMIADNQQGFFSDVDSSDISSNELIHIEDYQPKHSNRHAELKNSAGPLSAILSAMQHLQDSSLASGWLIVVSCDSLISAPDILNQMNQDAAKDAAKDSTKPSPQIYCLKDDDQLYPLLGMYQLAVADRLRRYLDAGERRVMNFVTPLCQPVTMPQAWYPLSNLNTPEQFHRACQKR